MEAADLRPGVLVKVPQGADPARAATAYVLHVRSVEVWRQVSRPLWARCAGWVGGQAPGGASSAH